MNLFQLFNSIVLVLFSLWFLIPWMKSKKYNLIVVSSLGVYSANYMLMSEAHGVEAFWRSAGILLVVLVVCALAALYEKKFKNEGDEKSE